MSIATALTLCVVAHFVADFPLQGDFLANGKKDKLYLLAAHSVIWAGLVMLPLLFAGWHLPRGMYAGLVAGNAVIHGAVDRLKVAGRLGEGWTGFYMDQLLHGLQIVAAAMACWLLSGGGDIG